MTVYFKMLGRLVWLCLIIGLGGCATVTKPFTQGYSADIEQLLSGTALLGAPYDSADLPNFDLFAVTPDMKAFAERAVRRQESYFDKVKALHVALLSPRDSGLGIAYSAYTTEIPSVTFAQRRANCLSFTLLYVALARQVGIKANVNEVRIPPTWDLRNKNDMVFLRHVNVRVPMTGHTANILKNDDVIIDLEMNRYSFTYDQYSIDDDLIAAQYYSNRAMEFLENKDARNSFLYLRKAISMNDQQSYLWSNLGALYGRYKLYHESELAYLHGLDINPEDLTIMNNLAYLYQQIGNKTNATKYIKLAQRYRESNPYYQYNLALSAAEEKKYEYGLQFVKRAIEREKKEVRFYELAASIYNALNNKSAEASMLKKIQKIKDESSLR